MEHAEAPALAPLQPGGEPPEHWTTGRLLSAVARRIEREWNSHLSSWDLTHASLPALALLAAGPRSQRELAAASGVTEQTMSRIIARLERTEYVTREAASADRRRHEVRLTDAGRVALVQAGDPAVAEELSTRGLSAVEIGQLRALLATLLDHLPDPGPAHADAGETETARG